MKKGLFKVLMVIFVSLFLAYSQIEANDNMTKEKIENLTQSYKVNWYDKAIEIYNSKNPDNQWEHPYFKYIFPDDADFVAGNPPDKPITSYKWMKIAGVGLTKKLSIPSWKYTYTKELVREWKRKGFRAGRIHIDPTDFLDESDLSGYRLDEEKLKILKDTCQLFVDQHIPIVISTGGYGDGFTNFNEDWEGSFNHIIDWWRQIAEYFKDMSYLVAFENFIEYHGFDDVPIEKRFSEFVNNGEVRYPNFGEIDNYVKEPAYNNLNAEISKVVRVTNPKRVFIYKPRGIGRNNLDSITPWRWKTEIDPYPNIRTTKFYWLISTGGGANLRTSYIKALREENEDIKKELINEAKYNSWGNIVDYHNATQLPVWVSLMGIKADSKDVEYLDGKAPTTEEVVSYINWYLESIQTLAYNTKTMKRDKIPNGFQQSWWLWDFDKDEWNRETIFGWDAVKIRDALGSHSFGRGLKERYYPPAFLNKDEAIYRDGAYANREFKSSIFYEAVSDKDDDIKFVKVSGPKWLDVLEDGTIVGTPSMDDVGENVFEVGVVGKNKDMDTKILKIDVSEFEKVSFVVSDDTYSQRNKPDTTAGDKRDLIIQNITSPFAKDIFLKFDVSVKREIAKATLNIYYRTFNGNVTLSLVENDWSENNLTWNTRPNVIKELVEVNIEDGGYNSIDLTPFITKSGTYSFELKTYDDIKAKISSKERGNPATLILYLK
ncbi:MAG: DNRLRE domain-containing protein [Epsilonproteobacteria bacterium]|nr:DNRLRE domain-containing protein [Campylobacterota bacterium]